MKKDFVFNGQRDGEEVIDVVNNHPYVLYLPGIKTVLLFSGATAIWIFSPMYSWVNFLMPLAVVMALIGIWLFSAAFYSFKESILVITNQRLFSINQKGFFSRKITELDHRNIQDISSESEGLAKMMLHFGDLIIRTAGAGTGTELVIKNIADPYDIQQLITRTYQK
ncbi:MAG: PH domain-containing protein [Candidatus Berkelbacteria bacterium]